MQPTIEERDTDVVVTSNVEIVQRLMDAFFSGDVAALVEIQSVVFDPDIEFRPPPEHPDFDVYRGLEEMNRAFSAWVGAWETIDYDAPEYIDAGDRVLVASSQRGKAKGSGIEVATEFFNVFTLRSGKIVRFDMYFERGEALAAAGIAAEFDRP